jgi:hypothetical protein
VGTVAAAFVVLRELLEKLGKLVAETALAGEFSCRMPVQTSSRPSPH